MIKQALVFKPNKNTFFGLITVVFAISFLASSNVFGQGATNLQGSFNMSTTPVVSTLETKPGTPVSTKIKVKNNNQAPEQIKVSLLRFSSNNQDGRPQLSDVEQNDEFLKWVKFSETNFVAEPNVWKEVDVTISPDKTAAFGYYYAVVFQRAGAQPQSGQTASLAASVAVPILLNVEAPGEVRKASITEFMSNHGVFEFLPAKFTVKLKNEGNTHVAPRGNIFITKGGKNISTLDINKGRGNLLPNSSRVFDAEWNDGSPVYKPKETEEKALLNSKGEQVYSLNWDNFDLSKLRFGKYHAKVALVYDDGKGDVATEAELDFWVIPWKIIGLGLLILLFIFAGLWALVIRPIRRGIKKIPSNKKNNSKNIQ